MSERTYSVIVLALVEELGVGLDQADELLAAHLLLLGSCPEKLGDQAHDVVVVDEGRGEEDELEIELVDLGAGALPSAGLALLLPQPLGGFEVRAAEAALSSSLGRTCSMAASLLVGEVGVLVELGLEPLHFLELLDERRRGRRRP